MIRSIRPRTSTSFRPHAPINAWAVEDPAIRQLSSGTRRRYLHGNQSVSLIREVNELEEKVRITGITEPGANITGRGMKSSMATLAFLTQKSAKAKDKAGERLQELSIGESTAFKAKQPRRKLQRALDLTQHKRSALIPESMGRIQESAVVGEFVADFLKQFLKQAHPEIPALILTSLVSRLTEAILEKAVDWSLADTDIIVVKLREMLDREELKRILSEYGIRLTKEMLKFGDQMRSTGSTMIRKRLGLSTELLAVGGESDMDIRVSHGSESDGLSSASDFRYREDSRYSIDAFYNIQSEVFGSGIQKHRLLSGSLEDLPHTLKRVVRVYLCSVYSDMIDERNWILRRAVPKLQSFAQKNHMEFQLVDLRWGLSEETAYEPENLPIYFDQIEYCRKLSSGPFFVALVGNKYGNAELPLTLSVSLFEIFEKVWSSFKILHSDLLLDWYQLDTNAVPPVYCLQPVSSKIASFGIMEYGIYNEQLQKTAARKWFKVEQNMRDAIERTLLLSQDQGVVTSDTAEFLAKSVLDKEVKHVTSTVHGRYSICYARNIDGLEMHIDDELAPNHIDIVERNEQRMIDRGKQRRIQTLKDSLELLKETLANKQRRLHMSKSASRIEYEDENEGSCHDLNVIITRQETRGAEDPLYLHQYIIDWEENMDSKTLTAEQKAFLTAENEIYLEQLMKDFVRDCKEMIATFVTDKSKNGKLVNAFEEELIQQAKICNQLASHANENFYNISDIKERLDYCLEQRTPLIIHGETGCGISTLVATICSRLRSWYGPDVITVIRFIGTTPKSLALTSILTTINRQVTGALNCPAQMDAIECQNLRSYLGMVLQEASKRVTDTVRLFIILEGLDLLNPNDNDSHCLSWLPKAFPPNVQMIISSNESSSIIMRNLRNWFTDLKSYVEVTLLSLRSAEMIVQSILNRKQRTLTDEQLQMILREIISCTKPLFIALVMHQAVLWKSNLAMATVKMPETIEMAVSQVLSKLESKLGATFVRNAITFITISEGGLTETEWEDALACDDEVLDEVFPYKDQNTNIARCPQLFMARLRYHLGDLLLQRDDHSIPVFFWFNKAVETAIFKNYLTTGNSTFTELYFHCNRVLADLFLAEESIVRTLYMRKRNVMIENADRRTAIRRLTSTNTRKLHLLPKFLYRSADEANIMQEYKEKILCNMNWLLTKLKGCPFAEVLKDFDLVNEKDDDVLTVYGILTIASESIIENPETLQLEILSRFSKIPKANSECIDRMVHSSRHLVTSTNLTLLYPLYPCVPAIDLSLKLSRRGPTHLLGVFKRRLAIVWGLTYGLEIWQIAPNVRILYHLSNDLHLPDIIVSPDRSTIFFIRLVTLYKWSVSTGAVIGQCDLLPPLTSTSSTTLLTKDDRILTPMAADHDNTRLAARANITEALLDSCGLIVVDTVGMTVIGSILEMSFGNEITNVEFFDDSLFVTQNKTVGGRATSRVLIFNRVPLRAVTGIINLPPRLHDVPGCFQGLTGKNLVYLGCLSDAQDWEQLECEVGLGAVNRRMVGLKITDVGLIIVVFACHADPGYSVLVVLGPDGKYRAHAVSKAGQVSCMELTNDHANVFVGYRSVGIIEVYDLPFARLAHSFQAHAGDVNCIQEVDSWQVYSCGSDSFFRHFDLTLTSLAMDFTKRPPRRIDEETVLTDEDVFTRRSVEIQTIDVTRSDNSQNKLVICYENQGPVIAEVHGSFVCHSLHLPPDVDKVHCAWFAVDDTLVVGLASLKEQSAPLGNPKQVLIWNAYNRQIVEREAIFADDCCLSKDGLNIALMRTRKTGTSMAVFRIKENEKIRKYRSGRFIEPGVRLLTDDCRYLVSVEPKEGCLVVWKLHPRDIESQVEDYTALSESEPNDDANCTSTFYEYDERGLQRRLSRLPPKTIFERESEYEVDDLAFAHRPHFQRPKRRTRFILKMSIHVDAVTVNKKDSLIVGNSRGQVIFFYLNQLSDGIHNFYSILNVHESDVTTISVSPNERFVLTGSKDNKMKIYDMWENETQSTLVGHTDVVNCIGISSKNQFVVSGSSVDQTIRVWNLMTGRLLASFNACVDIYKVFMFRQRNDQLKVIALGDKRHRKKLMLLRTINLITTNKRENF